MDSLYQALKRAGIPLTNHASDLYFPATDEALAILAQYRALKGNATFFTNQKPPHVGDRWVSVPFAFEPFWQKAMDHGSAGGLR